LDLGKNAGFSAGAGQADRKVAQRRGQLSAAATSVRANQRANRALLLGGGAASSYGRRDHGMARTLKFVLGSCWAFSGESQLLLQRMRS
jgi:hypothetical protein